jgi:repressor LexA
MKMKRNGWRLSRKQWDVANCVRLFLDERGHPPTRVEIAEWCEFKSPNSATKHVNALVRKGVIERSTGVARGLRLCEIALPWILQTAQGESLRLVWAMRK